MHSAVMQNKKYIKFAEKSTVEVLALGGLDQAVEKKDPKAATYKTKDGRECMVQWPSLTYDEIMALRSSPAGRFNDTGGIPYTCIVNPHTAKKMSVVKSRSASGIEEEVEVALKELKKEYGKGYSRKALAKVNDEIAKVAELNGEGKFDKALKTLKSLEGKNKQAPELVTAKIKASREAVMTAARAKLDEVMAGDPKMLKRELNRLIPRLKGTGLEEEARSALKSL
jgi:hypothetical protein